VAGVHTGNHGYHVFDTLFSMDTKGVIHPQMAEAARTSADGLTWEIALRPGLAFHDGAPVTAADCVASLKRWMPLDSMGRMLAAATETMEAKGASTFTIVLKHPFPLMLDVLGKPNAAVPFIMPARIIPPGRADRIKETVGGILDQIASLRRDLEQIVASVEAEIQNNRSILVSFEKVGREAAALGSANAMILQGADQILAASTESATGARQIASAAEQASAAARQASTAATEQASGAEDLAAAVEEIASLADTLKQQNG